MQEAIKNHQVLVGMDRDMVIYAKGRPPKKIRDKDDSGTDYEEWIYGDPPQEVEFVRFQGASSIGLEIMTVDGQKVVRTEKEVELGVKETQPEARCLSATARTRRRFAGLARSPQDPAGSRVSRRLIHRRSIRPRLKDLPARLQHPSAHVLVI